MQPEWKHQELNPIQRVNFIYLYLQVEAKSPIFRMIKYNAFTMFLWFVYIMMFGYFSVIINYDIIEFKNPFIVLFIYTGYKIFINKYFKKTNNRLKIIYMIIYVLLFLLYPNVLTLYLSSFISYLYIISGTMGLQKVFEATHVISHAKFLLYSLHVAHSALINQPPIYFYAFYHHHHQYNDDWAPFLSYHDHLKNSFIMYHTGTRNVIAAHWHGYTLLASKKLLIVIIMIKINTQFALYFFGYEIGVLMLPLAHGWQHIPKIRFGYLIGTLFYMLDYLGIIANKDDHGKHHVHTGPSVYQDFCSSGFLYSKNFDEYINKLWNKAFYNGTLIPSEWLNYYVFPFCIFILIGVPFILCLCEMYFMKIILTIVVCSIYISIIDIFNM